MNDAPAADAYPSAAQLVPVSVLALRVLADLRGWAEEYPQVLRATPVEALAISAAAISPWRGAAELRLSARMYMWAYALDDHVEQRVQSIDEFEDLAGRATAVVRGDGRDDTHPLLASLSDWQASLTLSPRYPDLAQLWADRFAEALRGERYDWVVGRAREAGQAPSDVDEYLRHAASSNAWITHFPRWPTSDRDDLLDHLPVLNNALAEIEVAVRLANDLASYERERAEPGQNNILMYGVSPEWVRNELARHAEIAQKLLNPLSADGFPPAVEALRLLDWSVTFYCGADLRGWGSDASSSARRRAPSGRRESGSRYLR